MTPRDFDAPTSCFCFHCDCNGGMSAPSHQRGWQWLLGHPRGGYVLLPQQPAPPAGSPTLLPGAPPCCAAQALFCLHGLGSSSLCLFAPCHRCAGFPRYHCPLFYILLLAPALPKPCKCVHSVPLCPYASAREGPLAPRVRLHCPFAHSAVHTWSLCTGFFILVVSLGTHIVPRPACREVSSLYTRKGRPCVEQLLPQTSPCVGLHTCRWQRAFR